MISIAQMGLTLVEPGLLIPYDKRFEVLRRRSRVVDPLTQQRPPIDHVNGELAVLVFVREVAPERIVRVKVADCLEGQRQQVPGPERLGVVSGAFSVNLHAAAELADMLMKRRFEPAIAQAAAGEPLWCERVHLLDDT